MYAYLKTLNTPLFDGIAPEERVGVLGCVGFHVSSYSRGQIIAFDGENMKHIGIVLSGCVDILQEDIWGNRSLLLRLRENELFGETFACGDDNTSLVTFAVSADARILFLPFSRVMHSCSMACSFHHRLMENMVRIIAAKNRELLHKAQIISRRTLREKILTYLSLQSQNCGSRSFEIRLGRGELAEYLCADRSALTRELAAMKREGILDFEKNRFHLL